MTRTTKLIFEDCMQEMLRIPSNSVELLMTSPPYNCGKEYGTLSDKLSAVDYWAFTDRWLRCALPLLVDGGRLAVNIPWWMGKKPRNDFPFHFKQVALKAGFIFLDKIIWIKGDENNVHVSGGFGGGGCGWGTYMSPSGPAIRCASEPILIFSKNTRGRKKISGAGRGVCLRGDITKEEFHEWTKDTWFIKGASSKEHPAVFPLEIPTRIIKLYTFPGETVLDPFMGTGTTGLAAKKLGRKFIGIDRESKYVEIAKRRINV